MGICPICGYEMLEHICPLCFYDRRRDFVSNRTIVLVPETDLNARRQSIQIAELYRRIEAEWLAQQQVEVKRKTRQEDEAESQYQLGLCYEIGRDVVYSDSEAVKCFRKAAELGHANAQMKLGYHYHEGKGVPQDYAEAVKWHRKAAEQGVVAAQYNLGICYEFGIEVAQNKSTAMEWYQKAAAQGFEDAEKKLESLSKTGVKPAPLRRKKIYMWSFIFAFLLPFFMGAYVMTQPDAPFWIFVFATCTFFCSSLVANLCFPSEEKVLEQQKKPKSKHRKKDVLLKCILGGMFGLHRFSVGKYLTGILYLLTFGGFWTGWIYDIVVIASGEFADKNGDPIQ